MLFKASSITLICSGVEVLNSGDFLNSCNCFFTCCNCFLVTLLISPKTTSQLMSCFNLSRLRFANASSHSFCKVAAFPASDASSIRFLYLRSIASFFWVNKPYLIRYSFQESSCSRTLSLSCSLEVLPIIPSKTEVLTLTVDGSNVSLTCFGFCLAIKFSLASNFSFSN